MEEKYLELIINAHKKNYRKISRKNLLLKALFFYKTKYF